MKPYIFHSVNAGLFFYDNSSGVLIDSIHRGYAKGLSDMPESLIKDCRSNHGLFSKANGLAFTHHHPDHYNAELVKTLLNLHPQLKVFNMGATTSEQHYQVSPLSIGNFDLIPIATKHDGNDENEYENSPHYSLILKNGGFTAFIAGDALLNGDTIKKNTGFINGSVDMGFFNLYQLATPYGQEFVKNLDPKRVMLYHLPFVQDDIYHYYKLVKYTIKAYPTSMPPLELPEHMKWVDSYAPAWADTVL